MSLVRSPLLDDTRHGFSTRTGGVSTGRFATLNLGRSWGDDPANVEENRRRLAAEGGFDLARMVNVKQVHGRAIAIVDGHTPSDLAMQQADGLVASDDGVTVSVVTADCVPILISDGAGRVAAVHAGWRGTVANIAAAAVEALVSLGARRESLRAAIGPCIGACCFEVGEEVACAFEPVAFSSVLRGDRKPHIDLRAANLDLLVSAGVPRAAIDTSTAICTHCDPEQRFYSFRRDGAGIGQMLSFIVAGKTG